MAAAAKLFLKRNVGRVLPVLAAVLLSACRQPPTLLPPAPLAPIRAPAALPSVTPAVPAAASMDEYKELVARKIMATSPDLTFKGKLPSMLTAIVVLDIAIDRHGELVSVHVHRAPDQQSSDLAQAAVRRAAPYLQPGKLLSGQHKALTFSETFLFNRDYQFQLRTLSGPQ